MRNFFRSIFTVRNLWYKARFGLSKRDQVLAFLIAGLASINPERHVMRNCFLNCIDCFTSTEGQVTLTLNFSKHPVSVGLRGGNEQDLLVCGEIIKMTYTPPPFTPLHIVDGGANIGIFTLFAYSLFPTAKMVCYEPNESNLTQLYRNLNVNSIPARVEPVALWSKETKLYYHHHELNTYSGYIDESPSDVPISCTLPEIGPDCWLKLDIEGGEYEVVPALLESGNYPRWLTMEIHDFNHRGLELITQLREHGYQVTGDLSTTLRFTTIQAEHKRENVN